MIDDPFRELHPDIARALRVAFGDQPLEDLAVLTGGRSGATLLSLSVAGKGSPRLLPATAI